MKKLSFSNSKKELMTFAEHLAILIKTAKITLQELSSNTGVPTPTIHRLLNDPNCNPTLASLTPLAKFFRISVSQLLVEEPPPAPNGWCSKDTTGWRSIPLLDIDGIQSFDQFKEKLLDAEHKKTIQIDIDSNEKNFAIEMYDNSMLPLFPQGTLLVFEQTKKLVDKAYVLVFIKKEFKIAFKQIYFDGKQFFLKSSSNSIEIIKMTEENLICGILVQSIVSF